MFLNPGETHANTYNLIGFKLVEGCYTFLTADNILKNYVLDFDSNVRGDIEIQLPSIVGEYLLYSGPFNTNMVTVCFWEK